MRRVGLCLLLAACSGRAPEGANDGARFLLIEPASAPPCGPAIAVPTIGNMPDLDRLADDDAWLFQLDPVDLEAHATADETIEVYAVRDDVARWGTGIAEVPMPQKTWHWTGSGFDEVDTAETVPRLASYRLVTSKVCTDVVAALCETDAVTPCDRFEHFDVKIQGTVRGIGVAVAVDDKTVLVSAADRTRAGDPAEFFLVRETSIDRVVTTSTQTPFGGGFMDDDGVVWMYGPLGRFATWSAADGITLLPRPDYQTGFVQSWLTGSSGGGPFELFALTDGGGFEHFDGTTWREVHNGTEFVEKEGGVVWLERGHALSIGSLRNKVARFRDGIVTESDLTPLTTGTALTALSLVPGFGVMVGTNVGEIFVERDGEWAPFEEGPRDGLEVNGLLPYRDGFLFGRELAGLEGGWAVQYVPGFGLCPAERVSEADLRRIQPMGPRSFFVIGEEEGQNSWVSLVDGVPRSPVCETE